jgi:hypothetical protein
MPSLSLLKLTDKLACQAPQAVYGVLHPDELVTATDVQAVEDVETLAFQFARVDQTGSVRAITAQMRAGRVVTVVWDDSSFDEWRVGTVIMGRGEKGLISVTCVPLWLDLVERADSATGKGWVSDVSAGSRNFEYEFDQRTPSSILSTYVIPACPTWVTLGTVDPTYVIPSLSASRMTPGALALLVRDTLRNVDVPCEVRLRRNGSTDYKLDLVTQIGASAATPVFHPSNSLLTLQQKADPTLQATRVLVKGGNTPDGFPGEWGISRWRGGAPSGNVIALTDRNGGMPPIAFDGQFVGMWLLRVKTGATFAITASSAAGGTVTLGGGVSTIAADEDFEFRLTEPGTNTRTTTTRYAVSAVPDGTHITCGASNPILANGQYTDWYARVWTLASGGSIIITSRISGSVASTDVIAVLSSAGVNNTHFVEFIQLDGAGEVPTFVDHPVYSAADPVGYGIKAMELSKPMLGVQQLAPNAWMRSWSNSANPPDGWTLASAGTTSQNTNAAFTRYGGLSWKFISTNLATGIFTTPPIYPVWDVGHAALSVRAWVYFTTYSCGAATPNLLSALKVYALNGAGALGALLGTAPIQPTDGTPVAAVVAVATGTWIEVKVKGITLGPTTAPYGIVAQLDLGPANGVPSSIVGYLDAIEVYPFGDCPSNPFEFGDAVALEQSGNNQLRQLATPPLYYQFLVLDLERAFPNEYGRLALTVGGNVRAADVEYGQDVTVRLLRRDRDLLDATKTQLTLANRPALMTTMQAAGAAAQQKVIAAVVQGTSQTPAAPPFVTLTAATTLTPGAEISTPIASAPVVTLPAGTTETGAAVTFVPADPTTAPTTVVTSGTPPSRLRSKIPLF